MAPALLQGKVYPPRPSSGDLALCCGQLLGGDLESEAAHSQAFLLAYHHGPQGRDLLSLPTHPWPHLSRFLTPKLQGAFKAGDPRQTRKMASRLL